MFRIFLGHDSRFPEPSRVAAYSFRRHSSVPLDIRFLDLRHLKDCYGFQQPPDLRATTEFTYSRFLVPWLCGYDGLALFADNDIVCTADVAELFALDMAGLAIRCVHHEHEPATRTKMYGAAQTVYPRKNFSSVMLLDCTKLRAWTKPVVEAGNGARLHRFQDVPDAQIGRLDPAWNRLEHQEGPAKIRHWTEGGPWYPQYDNCPYAELWKTYRRELLLAEGSLVED